MKLYTATNKPLTPWLGGIALGALAMYLSDPAQGKRRRKQAKEKMRDASGIAAAAMSVAMHEASNRVNSLQSQAKYRLARSHRTINDDIMEARINSKLHRLLAHPETVHAAVQQGYITLTGSVPEKEHAKLIKKLSKMSGAIAVHDNLVQYDNRRRWTWKGRRSTLRQPAESTAKNMASSGAGMFGMAKALPMGSLLAVAGLGLAIRNLSNGNVKKMLASLPDKINQTVTLQKSIDIQASPETVFDIWSNYENFPKFMSHVNEVRDLGMQRSRWMLRGATGVGLEWDVVLTKCLPPTMLAWKTEPDASVGHSGSVRFESANGGTRVTIRVSYCPVTGAGRQQIMNLLGSDPEGNFEEDLQQMKAFIEGSGIARSQVQASSSLGQTLH